MILLSRLIKWTPNISDPVQVEKRVISIKILEQFKQEPDDEATVPLILEEHTKNILEQAQHEAEAILNKARLGADEVRQQLDEKRQSFEIEMAALTEQAKASGFASGLEEGRKEGYSECSQLIQSAKAVIDSAKKDYLSHVESSEKAILEIGLKVAQKILGKTIDDNEEEFLFIVKRALKEARENQEIQLHVHPNHYEFLLLNKEELIMLFPREVDMFIYPDDDLTESSCIIESANGRIDASIDSQLEEVKRKLIEMLEGE
ncbi:flagellar assembly protein FliH [Bacillus sp. FJAT-49705]|uniref:Flagellar assembly protein FliH n=1 Tax=Cytobacillus citreus TaxID=2833586 RepID=A0ABS5NQN4_9BACI|nr:flagellar assembly protein FliH [Cytobacillus citreus]MBS4189229.1 flagellar assembly protein FliH [Cytobacillus citreus]